MGEVFTTSGENSDNIVVPTPRLQGLFVPGIDNPFAIDGFGIVTPWGGGGTSRKYSDYGISGDISRQNTQLGDLASSLIPAEGAGISYNWEGLVGPQGPAGRDGLDGIIHIMGLNLPQNSNFLAELPHNIDQINDLGTAADRMIYVNAISSYPANLWTERQPAGDSSENWQAVDSDSDGSHLIAANNGGRLYTSADYGVNWTERQPAGDANKSWRAVASDSDGSHLIVGVLDGRLYTSANFGVTWTERQPAGDANHPWESVASDSDGSNLIACGFNGRLYTSVNYGVDWTERSSESDKLWTGVASDNDGSNLIVSWAANTIYTSINGGVDWTARYPDGAGNRVWRHVASNSDGSVLVASSESDPKLFVSIDSGVTWTERVPDEWMWSGNYRVACDSDGSHLIVSHTTATFTSSNYGVSWITEDISGWGDGDVASDDDGSNLISGNSTSGRLFTKAGTTLYSEATWAETDLTSAGRAILDDADAPTQATTLGLGTGDSPTWVGATFSGLTATYVPFIDTGGVLAEDSLFSWDKDNNYLTAGYVSFGGTGRVSTVNPADNADLLLNAKGTGGVFFNYDGGGSGGIYFYNGTTQKLAWFGGTTYGQCRVYDQDYAEWLNFACATGYGYLEVQGTSPNPLVINAGASSDVWLFRNSASGETKGLRVYGYKAGDAQRYLDITTGGTANDTVDFTGLSNYKFDGNILGAGLTITGNSVLGLNSAVFQPATDSTTFFQVLDADGGTPILNVDSINERVGIGTTAPNAPLEVKGAKPGVVGGFQSGQLQVTGSGGEFYCAVITGHNSYDSGSGPNTQLWYLGNTSSSSHNDIAFINRQNAPIHFYTNNTSRMTISAAGTITGLSTAAFEGASVTIGKASTTTGTLILHDSNSANTITLTVPDISAGSLTFTLPPTDGDNLDVLQTNGSGVLTWVAPGGAFTSRCSVWRNAAQSVPNITWTKILLNTEDYDIDGEFDSTTNYRFQPDVTGYYHVNVSANTASLNAGKRMYVAIYKNNSVWKEEVLINGTSGVFTGITGVACDMYLLDTDYIELWVYHNHGGAINVGTGAVRFTYMDVHRFA